MELNREIVKLLDELSCMQAKQKRLRELVRQRTELEQSLLGMTKDVGMRPGPRRRVNGAERVEDAPPAAG